MKRGFLNKDASRNTPKKNRASDESQPAQSQEIVAHEEPRFLFSDVCRLYSVDPYIVVADYRLPSSPHFLYHCPPDNPSMVFIDSLDAVQTLANWQVLKKPCPPFLNPPFIIRLSGSKGLGMFATRPIARGTLIMRERPVYVSQPNLCVFPDQKPFFYTSALAGLAPAAQAAIASLHNAQPETPDVGHVRGVVLTNALAAKIPHAPNTFPALFPHLCRANHDCTPNAHYAFCMESFCGQLFAVRSIAEGEEITIGYTDLTAKRAVRRENLEAKFRFVCECETCCLPQEQADRSDARREAMMKYFASMKKGERFPEGASLVRVKEMMHWAEEEGLAEAASILGISALRLAQRDKNHSEELKLMVSTMNYIRAVEGNDSPGFATLATRMSLKSEQLAAILDKSTPETIDYRFFERLLASKGKR